jgi:hypothetical protein
MPFYAEYSHLSVFAAASTRIFASAGLRQLGGEFDAKKKQLTRGKFGSP